MQHRARTAAVWLCAVLGWLALAPTALALAVPEPGGREPVARLALAFEARAGDEPLATRVDRVRAEASRLGMWSAEPAARGLLLAEGLGSEADRAAAAVLLAPGLPAAWGALAIASPGVSSGPALLRGLVEMERNLDASVWWRATAWQILAWGLLAGGILFLVGSALRLAPAAAHDLSHRLPGRIPPHALAGILASVGVLPVLLGEGLLGFAVGGFLLSVPWADGRHRAALLLAMAAVLAAVHPVTGETGRWIAALGADPATVAIRDAEVAGLSPAQRDRLARLAPRDPAAGHALALWSRRSGRLEEAERWLDLAGARESSHPVLLNDAANVRLAVGDPGGAIQLYENSIHERLDPAVLFNLAQVHGARIELARQQLALEAAHSVSEATVRELSELRGNGRLAVDIPWPVSDLRRRLASAADGRAVAASLRAPFGSGRLVTEPLAAAIVLAVLAVLAIAAGRGFCVSRICRACSARGCDRCAASRTAGCELCGSQATSPPLLDAVEKALGPVANRLIPGLAGIEAGHPWGAWVAAVSASMAIAAFHWREGVVADPLAAGQIGVVALGLAALLLALSFVAATAYSLRSLR